MKITRPEVEHVAVLARLKLTPAQIDLFARHMNDTLGYMEKLGQLDTTGVPPTSHATATVNAFREDEVRPSLTASEVLANAPADDGQAILVPRVI